MKKAMVVVVMTAVLAALLPAAAAAGPIVDARDPRGDVRFTAAEGMTEQRRRSVDLRRLTATNVERGVRFRLRLRWIARPETFEQFFFVYFENSREFGALQQRASRSRGSAVLERAPTPGGSTYCRVVLKVDLRRTRLTVDVPRRCLPVREAKVSVLAYTTPSGRRAGTVVYSSDRLRAPGTVDLTPTG
ncbi:hypothetical protein [Nocardioides bizhenqiangii]|uniref:DUF4390 domain-containing protein n=1 Tax=Nocardioides bizhenqiangii TaxID=3095076 RepID=A0ABZ0ZMK1_9ACTN|nr:hypothetical protein [Nocardioides sp. HM61]WQQ25443.1 hypothetical protein SHK19_15920 [Nocardioides sp. HM61]